MAAVIGALRVNLGLNSAEFETGMKKATGALGAIGKAFAALGGVALFAGFFAGIGQAVGRIEETRKLTAQLDKALENTGNTARTSGKEISDFADNLERSTGRAAEEVLAVGTNLATFGFSREVFFDAIKLADDMSAAWGGDLKQNVEGLARALADPEKGLAMLTKRGITFTDQQKQMIAGFMKANDIIGAQGVVMDALNEQVKGVAASGFTGLTKAQANATLAMETFFETIANAMGVNSGLEMSLTAVAAALDFVSQNFDVIARAAGVAGAAILTALGPTIWASATTAAGLLMTTVLNGIRAIGIAMAANPIGLIITALAAAVTAAILFRDEIKQIMGVDVVGAVIGAANATIGAFVGAYEAVKQAWKNLPTFFSALGKMAWNNLVSELKKPMLTINGQTIIPGLDIMGTETGLTDAELDSFSNAEVTVRNAMSRDYFAELGVAIGGVGTEASTSAAKITALGTALDGANGEGGATGGAKKLSAAADGTKSKLAEMGDMGKSVSSTLADGFKDIFKSVVTGSGSAMDAVGRLLGKLGDLFLDQAFNLLIGGFGGGGGGGGLFAGIGKLFGFARGGTIMPGGSGGIDSQLVTFRKSPNERVDITKPGQTLSGGASNVRVSLDSALLRAVVTDEAGRVVGQAAPAIVGASVQQSGKAAPAAMARYQNDQAGSDYRL